MQWVPFNNARRDTWSTHGLLCSFLEYLYALVDGFLFHLSSRQAVQYDASNNLINTRLVYRDCKTPLNEQQLKVKEAQRESHRLKLHGLPCELWYIIHSGFTSCMCGHWLHVTEVQTVWLGRTTETAQLHSPMQLCCYYTFKICAIPRIWENNIWRRN